MAKNTRSEEMKSAASAGQMSHRQIMLVLAGLMSGMFLAALDQTIVSTAMRTVADDLDGLSLQAWATTAYLITSTISTPIYGKLGDIFGRRPLFMAAIAIFVVGSLASGLATTMYELAAYRALQGMGAGGLFALALTIIADIVPPRDRARYQGFFLAVFGTSSVIGPVVGGFFAGIDQFLGFDGWRWIFLINLPIGMVSMALVFTFLHVPHFAKPQKIDWAGAATIVVGLVPLLIVAELGREWGWGSPLSVGMMALGVVGIIAFILVERAAGDTALIPLSLFKNAPFAWTQVMGFIVGVGMFGGMITLPLILQVAYGATPTMAGFLMLPMVGGMMVSTITAGQITSKTGKYRFFLNLGSAVMTLGFVYLFFFVEAEQPLWVLSLGMVMIGLGLGQLMQTLMISSQNAVEAKDIGVATSSATFFRQIGGTLGVAVFMTVLFSQVEDKIAEAFSAPAVAEGIQNALSDPAVLSDPNNQALLGALQGGGDGVSITSDSSFLIGADDRLTAAFRIGFVESSLSIFAIAAVLVFLGFIISWFIKEIPLRTKSAAQENAEAELAGLGA
ncbi:MAG: MDR family MFS transporter [Microbacteriaceae bacterium]